MKTLILISGISYQRNHAYREAMFRLMPPGTAALSLEDTFLAEGANPFDGSSYDLERITDQVRQQLAEHDRCLVSGFSAFRVSLADDEVTTIRIYIESDDWERSIVDVELRLALLQQAESLQQEGPVEFDDPIDQYIEDQRSQAVITVHHSESSKDSSPGLVQYALRAAERPEKAQQIDEMMDRFAKGKRSNRSFRMKRFLWKIVVNSTLFFKRLIDITATLVALLLLSPLFLIVGLAIKFTDGGNVFYFQTRVGKQGKEFQFPKFRSMIANADKLKDKLLDQNESEGKVIFKMKKDPRVTRIGRFIRRFSIDELPQLWCVLKGDMSLVGPRPPLPREVALYTQQDRRRLEVIPGLTGIWQVSGRSDIGFEDQVKLDVLYIESHSVWLDIKLLFKTVPAVLSGKGAY